MVFAADVGSMSPKRRPVLLAKDKHRPCCEIGSGMLSPALPEILPVENPVVLVGNQRTDDVHSLAASGQQQVLRRVPGVATIIHMDMGRTVEPSLGGHVDPALECNRHVNRFPGASRDFL